MFVNVIRLKLVQQHHIMNTLYVRSFFQLTTYILCLSASFYQIYNSKTRSLDFQCIVFELLYFFTFFVWCRQSSRGWSEWDMRVTGSCALSLKCIIILSLYRWLSQAWLFATRASVDINEAFKNHGSTIIQFSESFMCINSSAWNAT